MTGDDEFDAKVHKISELLDQAADIYSRQKMGMRNPMGEDLEHASPSMQRWNC